MTWNEKLQQLKAEVIAAIACHDGDNVLTVETMDFGTCRAVDMDDAYLLLPEDSTEMRLRNKKQMSLGGEDAYWDVLVRDMAPEAILEMADEIGAGTSAC